MKENTYLIALSAPIAQKESTYNLEEISKQVLDKIFVGFKKSLGDALKVVSDEFRTQYYRHSYFFCLGSFSTISFTQIDDAHFRNYVFRPNNPNYETVNRNFRHQIITGYGKPKFESPKNDPIPFNDHIEEFNFCCLCNIKISNSLILTDNLNSIIQIIESQIEECIDKEIKFIFLKTTSWHEFSLILFSNNICKMHSAIKKIRKLSIDVPSVESVAKSFLSKFYTEESGECDLITSTQSTYAINPKLIEDSSIYDSVNIELDKLFQVKSKWIVKPGHLDTLFYELEEKAFLEYFDRNSFKDVNGRSDISVAFNDGENNNICSLISFWKAIFDQPAHECILRHLTSIHSNIVSKIEFDDVEDSKKNTTLIKNLYDNLHYFPPDLEQKLCSLRIQKDIVLKSVHVFSSYNEVISDQTINIYFFEIKEFLISFYEYIDSACSNSRVLEVQMLNDQVLIFIEIFEQAYQNRLLISRRNGYNTDTQIGFNGGVHELISSINSYWICAYKMLNYLLAPEELVTSPLAIVGSKDSGIVATTLALHVNYFQLFQPEFFAFSIIKEVANSLLEKEFLSLGNNGSMNFNELRAQLTNIGKKLLFDEYNIEKHDAYHTLLSNDFGESLFNYLLVQYVHFVELFGDSSEELEKSFRVYSFWYWGTYLQNSTYYLSNGELNAKLLAYNYPSFYFTIRSLLEREYDNKISSEEIDKKIKAIILETIHYPSFTELLFNNELKIHKYSSELYKDFKNASTVFSKLLFELSEMTFGHLNMSKESIEENFELEIYLEFNKISKNLIFEVYELVKPSQGCINIYLRDENGKGVEEKRLKGTKYNSSVFDPHGGLFILNSDLRDQIQQIRLKYFKKLESNTLKRNLHMEY